jgi:cyclohexyl-isocyanide hydratase
MDVVMLAFPGMTQLDLTGPFEVFVRARELKVHIAAASRDAVRDANGLSIVPTVAFADCPQADILFVPGGPGQVALMSEEATLAFVAAQAAAARFVTSVCSGSLILAAAGLLTGYRATCHWSSLSQLAYFGCEPVAERVVIDRNRITGAGVTSGIDFALTLIAELFGRRRAELIQLSMEYNPKPPFEGGSPASSDRELVAQLRGLLAGFEAKRDEASRAAAERLGHGE